MFERPDQVREPLYVITPIFNPIRYRSRWRLYEDFAKMVRDAGAKLYTCEVAFGNREFAIQPCDNVKELDNFDPRYGEQHKGHYRGKLWGSDEHFSHDFPHHLQLRTKDELWLKENILNLLTARLPCDAKYIAWVDADVAFSRPDWANETIQQLQHYPVVQMFSQSHDLDPNYEIVNESRSYAWCNIHDDESPAPPGSSYDYYYGQPKKSRYYWHPGYAWAARREALDSLGGFIDWAILGNGDYLMAQALTGRLTTPPDYLGDSGKRWLMEWTKRADTFIKRNLGYVPGLLLHYWHGPKVNRGYKTRNKILLDAKYDPEKDLKRDVQGLFQLNPDNIALRDGVREYFRARSEDDIRVDTINQR